MGKVCNYKCVVLVAIIMSGHHWKLISITKLMTSIYSRDYVIRNG